MTDVRETLGRAAAFSLNVPKSRRQRLCSVTRRRPLGDPGQLADPQSSVKDPDI